MSEDSSTAKRAAILVEDDFEDRELPRLVDELRASGLHVTVVGPIGGREYRGKRQDAVWRFIDMMRVRDDEVVFVLSAELADRAGHAIDQLTQPLHGIRGASEAVHAIVQVVGVGDLFGEQVALVPHAYAAAMQHDGVLPETLVILVEA